ncbi:MAG: tRNA guanosine(34) transglycosylase Tgt, partial [Bacteroidetes bacterium SW_11_45_7]
RDHLGADAPRYLMGVGTPANMLETIGLGVDMFDCVIPTRNGRNGMLFTKQGIINIKNRKWCHDLSPIDEEGEATVSRHHTKAYLRHLILAGEMLGSQIASLNNISFYLWLMREAREQILNGTFHRWKESVTPRLMQRL